MLVLIVFILALIQECGTNNSNNVYWEHYGNDVGGSKFSSLRDIDKTNVARLKQEWVYRWAKNPWGSEHRLLFRHQGTPLMVDDGSESGRNLLVFCLPWRSLVALEVDSGNEVWINNEAVIFSPGVCRGIATWVDTAKKKGDFCRRRIYMTTLDLRLMAVDAATGQRCPDFGDNGYLNMSVPDADCGMKGKLCYWYSNPPVVIGDMLAIGAGTKDNLKKNTPKGRIPGYHARTGAEMWKFWIIPVDPDDPAMVTWPNGTQDIGSGNAWAPLSGDEELGIFFVPTSSPTGEHQGIHRPGDNHHSTGVLALNASTGRKVWFTQLVHHDIWDYDVNSQPVVTEITKNGQRRKVIVQGTKMGFVFVLDALTGEPVYEVEELQVKQSRVPGEFTSPTQLFPRDAFLRLVPTALNMTPAADLWGFTDADAHFCQQEMLKNVDNYAQIFDPADLEHGVLWVPGNHGGQHLSGLSVDAERGIAVIPNNHHPGIQQLIPIGTKDVPRWCSIQSPEGLPYWECTGWNIVDENRRPCYKPPWATMTTLDLNNGSTMWTVPMGYLPGSPEEYGSRWFNGGILLTGGGLVFTANTEDYYLRAHDIDTGSVLWRSDAPLPAQACGMPITYKSNGRQYLAVMAGGCEMTNSVRKNRANHLFVYALS